MKDYGVKLVHRPAIKVKSDLDLSTSEGRQIVRSETSLIKLRQAKTLAKLATL
ncbi:acetyltransferase [Pseudoalteromonas rubra]|uniref:acetyltransferase n=1 Tax=Pseudoalteromonas rubra TaxID=43658 RepID=UPI000A40A4F4|nr:acetyltransferase [Pseudoalteromonas rubra]